MDNFKWFLIKTADARFAHKAESRKIGFKITTWNSNIHGIEDFWCKSKKSKRQSAVAVTTQTWNA